MTDFKGSFKEIIQFYNQEEIIILLGLGDKKLLDLDNLEHCIKHLGFLLNKMNKNEIVYYLYSSDIELVKTQMDFISNIHFNRKDMVKKYFELIDNKKTKKKNQNNLKNILKNNNIKNNNQKK